MGSIAWESGEEANIAWGEAECAAVWGNGREAKVKLIVSAIISLES